MGGSPSQIRHVRRRPPVMLPARTPPAERSIPIVLDEVGSN